MTRRKVLLALAAAAALLPACAGDNPPAVERRYKLQGKVVAVKTNMGAHHLRIDGEEVRGETGGGRGGRGGNPVFMEKMTMDWRVKPEENITTFQPGDEISADVVVSGIRTHYIEHVTVTKKAEPAPPPETPPVGK